MSEYENTKQKIRKIFADNGFNTNDIEVLPAIYVNNNPIQFNKRLTKIELIRDRRIAFNTVISGKTDPTAGENYDSFVIDIPEDFISFAHVVPIVRLGGAFTVDNDDPNFFFNFKYWWSKITDTQFQLQTFMNVSANKLIPGTPIEIQQIPVYYDLLLYLKNPRVMRQIQTPKQ